MTPGKKGVHALKFRHGGAGEKGEEEIEEE